MENTGVVSINFELVVFAFAWLLSLNVTDPLWVMLFGHLSKRTICIKYLNLLVQ